ncbi:MAG: GGDEF domain-containing protein [Planctomycetes bacterium]|nr:GGDEF domain-containing protein [Planctomycetota bacterium]
MIAGVALVVLAALLAAWALRGQGRGDPSETRMVVADQGLLAARQLRLRGEQIRLEADLDLLRGVFEVSAELVGCVDEADLHTRLSSALSRYWAGRTLDVLVWERGAWRNLSGQAAGTPPDLGAPVVLPEDGGDLVLDLSPAVDGQAALVLRAAHEQPSIAGLPASQRRAVAELLRGQFALSLRRVILFRSLQELARSDPLTGSWRRWYGEARLAELAEGGAVVAVCIADIDHFKKVNDSHGHAGGDRVLAAVAKALAGGVRSEDLVARMGGEEFLILLPGTPPAGAQQVAERLRQSVAALSGLPQAVTVSLGVACCRRDESAGELVARADAALYRAKQQGRDRVVCDDPLDGGGLVRLEPAKRDGGATTGIHRAQAALSGRHKPV